MRPTQNTFSSLLPDPPDDCPDNLSTRTRTKDHPTRTKTTVLTLPHGRVSNLTQTLSSQPNSLPQDPELRRHLKTVQRILFESSEALAMTFGPPMHNNDEPILRAIQDLSKRMETQEAVIGRFRKPPASPPQTPHHARSKTPRTPTPKPTRRTRHHSTPSTPTPTTGRPLRYVVGTPPPITDRMTGERATKRLNARFKDLQTTQN
jgi:hypothetical protein